MKEFHIANMGGQASSIFPVGLHKSIWPKIHYSESLEFQTTTLDSLICERVIEESNRNMLVLDTQGSELEILKGSIQNLHNFDFIVAEAADFELYEGGCSESELVLFLEEQGFSVERRTKFASLPSEEGGCFEIVFMNRSVEYGNAID